MGPMKIAAACSCQGQEVAGARRPEAGARKPAPGSQNQLSAAAPGTIKNFFGKGTHNE